MTIAILLAQFSRYLHVHKAGLKPDSFIFNISARMATAEGRSVYFVVRTWMHQIQGF